LADLPATLDELFRLLGETCAVCGESTVREAWHDVQVAVCASCGSVLEDVRPAARPRLRLVP
jgi:transcription initiation factor TFIIIB Brf1 subunit/transcription initiation factor TFIIB